MAAWNLNRACLQAKVPLLLPPNPCWSLPSLQASRLPASSKLQASKSARMPILKQSAQMETQMGILTPFRCKNAVRMTNLESFLNRGFPKTSVFGKATLGLNEKVGF